jgi:hypothetical protein
LSEKKIEMKYLISLHKSTMSSMPFSATMTNAFTISMTSFAETMLIDAVQRLANKYGFDASEANDFLLSGGVHVKQPLLEKSKLPWCGHVDSECCKAIVKNGGLFTQCTSSPLEGGWCKKCAKDVEKNGTPTNGDVEARKVGDIMEYKIGKTEVKPYIEYMVKNGITREQVEEAAATYGLTIDPRQFEKKKRGRKNTTPRTMAPSVETPHPSADDPAEPADGELRVENLVETVTAVDLGALHRERVARASAAAAPASALMTSAPLAPLLPIDREVVEDDKALTIAEINGMKKDDVHRACAKHGISIDSKNILELKKELKAMVK